MKKALLTILIAYSFHTVMAQNSQQKGNHGGIWVVESNIRTPKIQTIKFYNSRLEVIYEETVSNRRIRYEKNRIKEALDRTLAFALNNEKVIQPGTFALVLKNKNSGDLHVN